MKKNLFLISIMLGSMFSCQDGGLDTLYSEAFVELDAATTITGSRDFTYLRVDDGQPVPSGFLINLAAAQQGTPVNVTFEVDTDASTAIEGLHYMVPSNTATIPANSSLAELPIMILDDNINGGESWSIVVNITSSDVPANPNYQTATHNIAVSCPVESSRFTGDYAITYVDADPTFGGFTFGPEGTVVTLEDASTSSEFRRRFSFIWLEDAAYGNGAEPFTLELNCGQTIAGEIGSLAGGGLTCADAPISLGASAVGGSYDPGDDSSFTLTLDVFTGASATNCGLDAAITQTVSFTKVE